MCGWLHFRISDSADAGDETCSHPGGEGVCAASRLGGDRSDDVQSVDSLLFLFLAFPYFSADAVTVAASVAAAED